VPALSEALANSEPRTSVEILRALSEIGAEAAPALPTVIKVSTGPDKEVRGAACWVLGRIGPAAIPALEKLLQDEDEGVRSAAAQALKKIRGDAK
jgi:HEAT repeat protein